PGRAVTSELQSWGLPRSEASRVSRTGAMVEPEQGALRPIVRRVTAPLTRPRARNDLVEGVEVIGGGLPLAGGDVRAHLLRRRRPRDHRVDRGLRGEGADGDI